MSPAAKAATPKIADTPDADVQPPPTLSAGAWRLIFYAMDKGPVFLVLLLLIFGGAWAGHYAITRAIPAHLETIQRGYEKNTEQFRAALAEDRTERKEQFREMKTSFDKATTEFSRAVDAMKERSK